MNSISKTEKVLLNDLLKESNLNHESILYRYTSEKYLQKKNDSNHVLIASNEPVEMVVDFYKGQGHVIIAKNIGKGLSFLTEPLDEYKRDDRVCVLVKLGDLLLQGGLMYKVTSLPAYITAFFFTIPSGEVLVNRI